MKMYYDLTLDFNSILSPQHVSLCIEATYGDALCSTNGNVEYDHLELNAAIYSHLAEQYIFEHRHHYGSSTPTELNKLVDELHKQLDDGNEDLALHYILDGLDSNNDSLIKKGIFNAFVHNISVNIKFPKSGTILPSKYEILEFNPFAIIKDSQDPISKTDYIIEFEIFDGDADSIEEFSDYPFSLPYSIGEFLAKYCPSYYFHKSRLFSNFVDYLQRLAAKELCAQHTRLLVDYPQYYFGEYAETTPLENFLAWACKHQLINDDYRIEMLSEPTTDDAVDCVYQILKSHDLVMLTNCYPED